MKKSALIGFILRAHIVLSLTATSFAQESATLDAPPGITAGELDSEAPRGSPSDALTTPEQARERLKTVVSLSFSGGDLRTVLSGLAKTYQINIVTDEKVHGTVNIVLKGVTLEEALKQILKLNGYTFVWEGSILKVASLEEEIGTEVLQLNFIQPDAALEFLKAEASETAVMKTDEIQNAIMVTDRLSKLEKMKEILEKIDIPPQQVLIQARLLDITHTDQDNLGLKFSSVSFDIPLRANLAQALLNVASGSIDLSGPSAELTTDTVTATISKGSETLTATLDALIRNKRVKVLASPTVTTLNTVEAKITIGEKFPIAETTQTTTGTLQTTRFVDIGITLRVTPKINRAGYIQMQIHPEVSSVSSTITAGPRITTREADTTVIIKDRESVVIAGLIKEEESITNDRIPFLGHIPGLGLLFSNRAKTYEQKELVIVITPYLMPVIPPQVAPESESEEVRGRLDALQTYQQAEDFEFGKTLQSQGTPEPMRIFRAIGLYESLANRFPTNHYAPEAIWRVAELSWQRLGDSFRSEEAYTRLFTQYPKHAYANRARQRVREIQGYLARQERKRDAQSHPRNTRSSKRDIPSQETASEKESATTSALLPQGFR